MPTTSSSLTASYDIKDWRKLHSLGALKRRLQTLDIVEALDAADVDIGESEPAQVIDNMLLSLDCPALLGHRFAEIESAPQEQKEAMMAALLDDISHDVLWRQVHFEAMIHAEPDRQKILDALLDRKKTG